MQRRYWTNRELDVLKRFYAEIPSQEIAETLDRTTSQVFYAAHRLGLRKSKECIARMARESMERPGHGAIQTRFKKGSVPANKGLRRPGWSAGRMRETQFKKGHKPQNWKPIYSTRLSKEGYLQMKMTDTGYPPRDWVAVHILIWEDKHGPIPPGYVLAFKDGDKTHIALQNLELIARADLMRRNSIHYRYPREVVNTIMLLGVVKRRLRENAKKEHNR